MALASVIGPALAVLLSSGLAAPGAPVIARPDRYQVLEDQVLVVDAPGVLANDSFRGRPRVRVVDRPDSGRLRLRRTGAFRFVPAPEMSGTTEFTYRARARGGRDVGTVQVVVVPVNDAPVLTPGPDVEVSQDAGPQEIDGWATGIDAGAPDESGQLLTIAVTELSDPELFAPDGAPAIDDDGTLTFTPAPGATGSSVVDVVISDNGGTAHGGVDRSTSTFDITVTAVDSAGRLEPDIAAIDEGGRASGNVLANDAGGQLAVATYSVLGQSYAAGSTANPLGLPGSLTIEADGDYVFASSPGWYGHVPTITYATTSGSTSTLDIWVTSTNSAPVARDDTLATTGPLSIPLATLLANDYDRDGDPLGVTLASGPSHGTVTTTPGAFVYTPDASYDGIDTFRYEVGDGEGGTARATVTIDVSRVNTAPVVDSVDVSTPDPATGAVDVTVNASDADGDLLVGTVTALPTHGSVDANPDGTFTYTPDAAYRHAVAGGAADSDSFTVKVSDAYGGTDTTVVDVVVSPANTAPALGSILGVGPSGSGQTVITVGASDADGDTITVTVSGASHGSVTRNLDGTFTYTPDPVYAHSLAGSGSSGSDSVTVTVDDGHGGTSATALTMLVLPVNRSPGIVVVSRSDPAPVTRAITITILATDPDEDPLTLTTYGASGGTVAVSPDGGALIYTPLVGYSGDDAFVVTADDGHGSTTNLVVHVSVPAVDDPPI